MGVEQKGKIQIFAKNIRGNANGGILEESKFTRNVAGGRQVQNGKGGGVNHDVNQGRTTVEETRVKSIECLDELDDGSTNDGSASETNFKKGVLYNKSYRFRVKEYTNGNPKHPNNIRWALKYTNSETGQVEENILQNKDWRGTDLNIRFSATECCGRDLEVRAYIENADSEGKLPIFMHNRFRWFDGKLFDNELQARKSNPRLINQSATSLCGTAAILYVYAKVNPDMFYNAYKRFFRTGEGEINQFKLLPDEEIFEMKPYKSNADYPHFESGTMIPQSDWVTLVGTRSSDNKSYTGKDGEDWDAINWPSYMVKAARELHGATEIEDKTHFVTGFNYAETLTSIEADFNAGWKIVLLIDSDMLDDSISIFGALTNYHWIVYNGGLVIDEKTSMYTFSYYCWAKEYASKQFRSMVFNTNFYGYIKYK